MARSARWRRSVRRRGRSCRGAPRRGYSGAGFPRAQRGRAPTRMSSESRRTRRDRSRPGQARYRGDDAAVVAGSRSGRVRSHPPSAVVHASGRLGDRRLSAPWRRTGGCVAWAPPSAGHDRSVGPDCVIVAARVAARPAPGRLAPAPDPPPLAAPAARAVAVARLATVAAVGEFTTVAAGLVGVAAAGRPVISDAAGLASGAAQLNAAARLTRRATEPKLVGANQARGTAVITAARLTRRATDPVTTDLASDAADTAVTADLPAMQQIPPSQPTCPDGQQMSPEHSRPGSQQVPSQQCWVRWQHESPQTNWPVGQQVSPAHF